MTGTTEIIPGFFDDWRVHLASFEAAETAPARASRLDRPVRNGYGCGTTGSKSGARSAPHSCWLLLRLHTNLQYRIGGRCWTANHLPGRPEFNASQVGIGNKRVMEHCRSLSINLVSPPSFLLVPGVAISLGGELVPSVPWSQSPQNKLDPGERNLLPLQSVSPYTEPEHPLDSPTDWLEPGVAALDALPLDDVLRQQGASKEALRLCNVTE